MWNDTRRLEKKIITSYKQKFLCVQNFNLKRKMKVKIKYHTFIRRQKVPCDSLVPALGGSWGLEIQSRSRACSAILSRRQCVLTLGWLFHETGFVIVISSDVLSCIFCSTSSTLIPAHLHASQTLLFFFLKSRSTESQNQQSPLCIYLALLKRTVLSS